MFKQRIARIQENLSANEAFLVADGVNRFYFTGFHSSAGTVVITPRRAVFLIDFRYIEKAKKTVTSCEVVLNVRTDSEISEILREDGIDTLYVEIDRTPVARHTALRSALEGITVLDDDRFDRLTENMRMFKTAAEMELICQAQQMTDETFSYILGRIQPGRTEIEVMLDMEYYIRRLGSEGVSFDFIVVSGANSSMPHGVPGKKLIQKGDFVTMDFGAVYGGYRSDMTRTVAVGEVSDLQRQVYQTVLTAQQAALKAIRPGLVCKDVDKIARDIINAAGYEGCFGHGLGHSVGLEIHENPNFNSRCEVITQPGMIMTVEPGIYIENQFGVRIEDMVWITDEGCKNLTASKKELIIL